MTIVDFDFDPERLKQFLDFPKRHYASDSNWIPDSAEGAFTYLPTFTLALEKFSRLHR